MNPALRAHDRRYKRASALFRVSQVLVATALLMVVLLLWSAGTANVAMNG